MRKFFIGRQPILNASGDTVAYELLFRSSNKNIYDPSVDGDSATSQVLINAVEELGLNKIVGRKLAFVNLTNMFLERPELLSFLPPDRVVLEVLESTRVNDAVIKGIETLKAANYKIALDDFCQSREVAALVPYANLIKYDITQHSMPDLCKIAHQNTNHNIKLLAERVETLEQYTTLQQAGFDYFQGYYFARPEIITGTKIPSNKCVLLHLLSQLNNSAISLEEITDILSRDVSLSIRALRYVNSPLNGLLQDVTSVQHATILLGRETIRHWVTLLVVADLNDKPTELINMALVRARFCQLSARAENLASEHACFTAGLLSLVDSMVDTELELVLDSISATQQMRDILLYNKGREAELLSHIRFIENASGIEAPNINISDAMNDAYFEAVDWADQATQLIDVK